MKSFIFYTLLLGINRIQFCNGVKSCRLCYFDSGWSDKKKPSSEEEECINGVLRKSEVCATRLDHLSENEITCEIQIVWKEPRYDYEIVCIDIESFASRIDRWCSAENKSFPSCADTNWLKYHYTTNYEGRRNSISTCTCNSDDCNTLSMLDYFSLAPKRKSRPGLRTCRKCGYDTNIPANHGGNPKPGSPEKQCVDGEKSIRECKGKENDTVCQIHVRWLPHRDGAPGKISAQAVSRFCATKDDSIPNCNDENWLKYQHAVRYGISYTICYCNFDNCNENSFGDYFGQNRKLVNENIINTTPAPSTPRPQSHFRGNSGNSKEVPLTALIILCTLIIHNYGE